MSQTSETYKLR